MTKEKSHLYEGMYILSATLSEDARKKALDRITSQMTECGGEVHKIFDQGRKKLAYEINGKRDGYYYLVYFSSPTSAVKQFWGEYHHNEDLIRFMTVRTTTVPEKIEFKPLARE